VDVIVTVGPVTVIVVVDEQPVRNNVDINKKADANKENILVIIESPFNDSIEPY
jgi:hypothetical protein